MSKLILEYVNVYTKYFTMSGKEWTGQTPTGILKIIHGRKIKYFVPYGVDHECEGGHYIREMSEEELNKYFSFISSK